MIKSSAGIRGFTCYKYVNAFSTSNNLCFVAVPACSSCPTWYGLHREQASRRQYPLFMQ